MPTDSVVPSGFAPFSAIYQSSGFEARAFELYCEPRLIGQTKRFGFRAEPRHINLNGVPHGGVLVAVIDTMMGSVVLDVLDGQRRCATISLTCDFLNASKVGDWLEGEVCLEKVGRTVAFTSGKIRSGQLLIVAASAKWAIVDGQRVVPHKVCA